jgi:hypothetical protein
MHPALLLLGTHDGRPRYVERNKENGGAFKQVIPAEIIFCKKIEAWVFRHKNIRTSLDNDYEVSSSRSLFSPRSVIEMPIIGLYFLQNPCSWLMKSKSTIPFDITSADSWYWWSGVIEKNPLVSIECIQCHGQSGCNYNGQCVENICACEEGFYGTFCQYSKPCDVMRCE